MAFRKQSFAAGPTSLALSASYVWLGCGASFLPLLPSHAFPKMMDSSSIGQNELFLPQVAFGHDILWQR